MRFETSSEGQLNLPARAFRHWRNRFGDKLELFLAESLPVARESGALLTKHLERGLGQHHGAAQEQHFPNRHQAIATYSSAVGAGIMAILLGSRNRLHIIVHISDDTKIVRPRGEITDGPPSTVEQRRERARTIVEAITPGTPIADAPPRHDLAPEQLWNRITAASEVRNRRAPPCGI